MSNEPILTVGAISGFIAAIMALVIAFGVHLSDIQTGAILAVIVAGAPIVTWYQARKKTVTVDKANKQIANVAKQAATTNSDTIKSLQFKKG